MSHLNYSEIEDFKKYIISKVEASENILNAIENYEPSKVQLPKPMFQFLSNFKDVQEVGFYEVVNHFIQSNYYIEFIQTSSTQLIKEFESLLLQAYLHGYTLQNDVFEINVGDYFKKENSSGNYITFAVLKVASYTALVNAPFVGNITMSIDSSYTEENGRPINYFYDMFSTADRLESFAVKDGDVLINKHSKNLAIVTDCKMNGCTVREGKAKEYWSFRNCKEKDGIFFIPFFNEYLNLSEYANTDIGEVIDGI